MQRFEKGGNLEMRNLTVCLARNSYWWNKFESPSEWVWADTACWYMQCKMWHIYNQKSAMHESAKWVYHDINLIHPSTFHYPYFNLRLLSQYPYLTSDFTCLIRLSTFALPVLGHDERWELVNFEKNSANFSLSISVTDCAIKTDNLSLCSPEYSML